MMNKTSNITKTALVSAITCSLLALSSLIPSASLSLSALAGFIPAILVLTCGYTSAFAAYFIAGFLSIIFLPDKNCAALFVLLFGYYSIVKQWIEQKIPLFAAYVCKLVFANIVFFLLFFFLTHVFLAIVPRVLTVFWVTWLVYQIAFLIYDRAASVWLTFCTKRIF